MSNAKRYFVQTWDSEIEAFSPHKGIRVGPYSLWGLREALRLLQERGYDTSRAGGVGVLVQDEENYCVENHHGHAHPQGE